MTTMRIILVITALGIHLITQAQEWFTNGNNPVGGEYLGTNNGFSLDFRTDFTQRMTLLPNQSSTINGKVVKLNGISQFSVKLFTN